MFCKYNLTIFVSLVFACTSLSADDWPQWLGPQRDSVWRESGIVKEFNANGLRTLWRQPVGGGYAGPAVADGRVFVTDYLTEGDTTPSASRRNKLQGTERVLCYAVEDGELLWKHTYDCPYNISFPAGPRATPTVDGSRVYTLGAEGKLCCLKVDDGEVVWTRDLKREYAKETPQWGFAAHPLIDGDRLICLAGGPGSIAVALDKHTGKEVWRSLSARGPGYCPPTMIEAAGTRQLLIWHTQSLNALDPATGKPYWSFPLAVNWEMPVTAPRTDGRYLFVGGVEKKACMLVLNSDSPGVELIWRSGKLGFDPVMSTPFLEDDHMYGIGQNGELCCVELQTGKRVWTTFAATSGDRKVDCGNAFLIKHEDRFFIANEKGELIIARLTPAGYDELDRAQLLKPTQAVYGRSIVWTHPAFANRCIFARNDEELVCVSLAAD
jgi:outer membrane protein assembly factor BamB